MVAACLEGFKEDRLNTTWNYLNNVITKGEYDSFTLFFFLQFISRAPCWRMCPIFHCLGLTRISIGQLQLLVLTHLGSGETRFTRASSFTSRSFGTRRARGTTLTRGTLEEEKGSMEGKHAALSHYLP